MAVATGGLGLGGTTTFLCNLGGEFVRRGLPFRVLSFESEHPLKSDFERQGIPVTCYDEKRWIFEDRLQMILEELAAFNPTVVLANVGPSSFEVLRYVPQGVLRVGAIQSDDPGAYGAIRHYTRFMDFIAAVSSTIRQAVEADPILRSIPVKYLPYGVSMPDELKKTPGVPEQALRILYFGRLVKEQKRVHLFPEILRHLQQSGISFHWTIAGDGPEREHLEIAMRVSSARCSIKIRRAVKYSEVSQLLDEHDVFLLVSDYERLPLSLLEAMGHGLVPVVSNLPSGIPQVVNNNTGKLVAIDDVKGYAEAIASLCQNRDELQRLSRNGRERVHREFSVGAMADRWLDSFPQRSLPVAWPSHWNIEPLLVARSPLYYSSPVRFLRRLLKRASTVKSRFHR